MEVLDIATTSVKDIGFVVANYPLSSAFGAFVLVICMMKFYCRLTLGTCESNQDMTGKTVLITGATSGIGKATAVDLARRNARVILACRNIEKAKKTEEEIVRETGNRDVVIVELNLASFKSVRKCAQYVLSTETRLDVLINNAGMAWTKKRELTEDGNEVVMQSNHLGHFLLTLLLIDLLKKSVPSRIINVSSSAYNFGPLDPDDVNSEKNFSRLSTYGKSKLANVYFTTELARRLAGTGVTVNCVHPGAVKTEIMQKSAGLFAIMTELMFYALGKTPEEGAQTSIHVAVHPALGRITGKYFADCKVEELTAIGSDAEKAKRLFEVSEKIVGETLKHNTPVF